MRAHGGADTAHAFLDSDPWIDDQLVESATAIVLSGESVVFAGPPGSGAPLYVAAVEAEMRHRRPELWKTVLWCPDSMTASPETRTLVVDAIRRGDQPLVAGLSTAPQLDAAGPVSPFASTLARAWLDGGAHRIDVGRLSDDALRRIMDRIGSAEQLPLASRARVIAWSNGVRVLAKQLHTAAVSAGVDIEAQRHAMAGPQLGSALFEAYATLLSTLTAHDAHMLSRLIDAGCISEQGASAIVGREMTMRLVAARVLSPTAADGIVRVPEPLVHVAAVLWPQTDDPDATPDRHDDPRVERSDAAPHPSPQVEELFHRTMQMDFGGARELAAEVLGRSTAHPRDRYLAAAGAGLATAYTGSWSESAVLFDRAALLNDVFAHDIPRSDEILGLWLEAFARSFAGADLACVRERLMQRAVAAARADDTASGHLTSALSACLHAMSGEATAAELDLAAVSTTAARQTLGADDWIVPIMHISVALCLALQGEAARAAELLQVSRRGAARTPLVEWFRSVADAIVAHAQGAPASDMTAAYTDGRLRTGSAGLLLEFHALLHIVSMAHGAPPSPATLQRLHELGRVVDAPVTEAVRRSSPDAPVDGAFLLWSGPEDAPASTAAGRSRDTLELLSEREREVALLIAGGLTNRAIAERLFLSVRTVESHVYVARQKVGAATRRDLGAMVAALAVAS